MKTAVFFAEGFEEIEALMVVDMLRRAQIAVDMISITDNRKVTGAHGITVTADATIKEVIFEEYKLLVLPGGMPGTIHLGECERLCEEVKMAYTKGKRIAAICAAPTVLGKLGLLADKKACCYPGMEGELFAKEVTEDAVTVDGNITTGRGLGTALDFALSLIGQMKGMEEAEELAEKVVYRR